MIQAEKEWTKTKQKSKERKKWVGSSEFEYWILAKFYVIFFSSLFYIPDCPHIHSIHTLIRMEKSHFQQNCSENLCYDICREALKLVKRAQHNTCEKKAKTPHFATNFLHSLTSFLPFCVWVCVFWVQLRWKWTLLFQLCYFVIRFFSTSLGLRVQLFF